MTTCDLTRNEKQKVFFNTLMRQTNGQTDEGIRFMFFGGGIRGGKTFVCLAGLVVLCKMFPESHWHVIRKSMTDLKATTIPSTEKLIKNVPFIRWKRAESDYFVEFPNGSRIYFMSENFKNDKDLNRFKGLESNGFLLEQVEELQEETMNKAIERCGSRYLEKMPPGFVLSTFNPTFTWVKQRIYDKYHSGKLEKPFWYLEALPTDNPFVTEDQWNAWNSLDERSRKRYIEGIWEFDVEGQFLYSYNPQIHRGKTKFDPRKPLWLTFDFNVDPMTCNAFQTDHRTYIHFLREFVLPNSGTPDMVEEIKKMYDKYKPFYKVAGDASGRNRISGLAGAINHYQIIAKGLNLRSEEQLRVPSSNPGISDSRTFCNSILEKFPEVIIDEENCPKLHEDLQFVLVGTDSQGKIGIQKTGHNKYLNVDNSKIGHLLDNFRYGLHAALHDFVIIPRS